MEKGSITWNDGETYTEAYARNLGPIDHYAEMTPKQLGERYRLLSSEVGAALRALRREPHSITVNELLPLLDAHHEAALRAIRAA